MQIVYQHPDGNKHRTVLVTGLGVFHQDVPREVDNERAIALLGPVVDGAFSKNVCFRKVDEAKPAAPAPAPPVAPLPPVEASPKNSAPAQEAGK